MSNAQASLGVVTKKQTRHPIATIQRRRSADRSFNQRTAQTGEITMQLAPDAISTACQVVPLAWQFQQMLDAYNDIDADYSRRRPTDIAAEWFPEIWQAYALKVGKGSAMKALASAIKREPGLTKHRLLDAVAAYIANKPPDIEFCHLATWLNGSRWDDEWPDPRVERDSRAGRVRGGDAVLAGMGRLAGRFADRMTPYEAMVAGFAADLVEQPGSQFGMRIGAETAKGA